MRVVTFLDPGLWLAALVLSSVACGGGGAGETPAAAGLQSVDGNGKSTETEAPTIEPDRPRVLFVGTSLTAGLGLSEEEAYPAKLAELLEARGMPIDAINAGVSGDTSAGGLERLDWLLRQPPAVVLIELGANDGLRGLPVEMTEANLLESVRRSQATGARVILAGMMMPPNYGADYTRRFAEVFPRVATETGSILVPFLLEGVAADPDLNQPDGIHPNATGHARIAETVLPFVIEALVAVGDSHRNSGD